MNIKTIPSKISIAVYILFFATASMHAQSFEELKNKTEKAYNEGDAQTALQYAEQAVKAYPNNAEANHNYGYFASFLVDKDLGLKHLEKAISSEPDSIRWYISRAEVLHYVVQDYTGSNKDLKKYEKASDQPEYVYFLMAKNYRQLDALSDAMAYIEKLEDSELELTADFYYTKADILMAQREYMQAIQAATQAINLKPDWTQPYFLRGFSFFQAFKYDYAIKDYDQYLALDPDDYFIHGLRGNAKLEIHDLEGALADFNASIRLNDQRDIAYIGRADYYRLKGAYDKALADLNKAAGISPNNVKIYGKLGMVYAQQNSFNQAVQAYTKAIQLAPKYADYYNSRALAYLKLDRNDLALADAKKALAVAPGHPDAYIQGGTALFNLNRFSEAQQFVSEGIQKNPEDGMLYYLRAAIHKELGNTTAAQADDAKAKQLLTK